MASHRQEKVQVAILCGGFGESMVSDLQHQLCILSDTTKIRLYKELLQDSPEGHRVTEALLNVHKAAALYHTVSSMQTARRLQPLDENVFFVCNDSNKGEFLGDRTGPGFIESSWSAGGLRLRTGNVVSNGAICPAEWAGEADDLQILLNSGILHPGADLIVIRGSLILMSGYLFSRLVEHPRVHNCNSVAYMQVDGPRASITHWQPHQPFILEMDRPETSCSRVLAVHRSVPQQGECGALGLAFIKNHNLQDASQLPGAFTIEEIGLHPSSNGEAVSGLNLQWGHFSTATLAELEYAESVFDSYSHNMDAQKGVNNRDRTSSLCFGDDPTLLGVPGDVLSLHARSRTPQDNLKDFAKTTDSKFFDRTAPHQTSAGLPPSFYMTQSRRDAVTVQKLMEYNKQHDVTRGL